MKIDIPEQKMCRYCHFVNDVECCELYDCIHRTYRAIKITKYLINDGRHEKCPFNGGVEDD